MASYKNFESDAKKYNNPNPYQTTKNRTLNDVATGNDKFMEKVKKWTSFYRQFPFEFAEDYLGLQLKFFQKIILYLMFHFNFVMFIAARGLGKSWITSVFCVCKACLYPYCQIVVASGNLKQATQIVKYIDKLRLDRDWETLQN